MTKLFRTSDGAMLNTNDNKLQAAREEVAAWFKENAEAVRKEDFYAKHVTEEEKETYLKKGIAHAEGIAKGMHDNNFTVWQRINTVLTGNCVALLN